VVATLLLRVATEPPPRIHTVHLRASQSVHGRYHRHPVDLPDLGNSVHIALLVHRFHCRKALQS